MPDSHFYPQTLLTDLNQDGLLQRLAGYREFLKKQFIINTKRTSIEKTGKVTSKNGTRNCKSSRQYKGWLIAEFMIMAFSLGKIIRVSNLKIKEDIYGKLCLLFHTLIIC